MSCGQTEKQHRLHGIDQDDEKFLGSTEMKETELCQINEKDEEKKERTTSWNETLQVNNQKLIVMLDCSVISLRDLKALKIDINDMRKSV